MSKILNKISSLQLAKCVAQELEKNTTNKISTNILQIDAFCPSYAREIETI